MQMWIPLSWPRRFILLKRKLRNTGRAGSSSTGSPPLPSPHPPPTPPPLVYRPLNVLEVIPASVDSLLCWFSPPWSPPPPPTSYHAQAVEWQFVDKPQQLCCMPSKLNWWTVALAMNIEDILSNSFLISQILLAVEQLEFLRKKYFFLTLGEILALFL